MLFTARPHARNMSFVPAARAIDYDLSEFLEHYRYQQELTKRLDRLDSQPFTQAVVNEIVLWKVNRYAALSPEALEALNSALRFQPRSHGDAEDVILTLLDEHGVDLPMASTLLRFRNRHTFQIIDRHAYRALYGKDLRLRGSEQVKAKLYISYLDELVELADEKNIEFHELDRVLYEFDRAKNGQLQRSKS
jgi:thermostable 8-oxoguanine DNA glycosylase